MRPLVQGYDELKLRIDPRGAGSYHVLASTGSAEASTGFHLPFSGLEIENFRLTVGCAQRSHRSDGSAIGEARRFGGGLFKALFQGEIHGLYRDALSHARGQGRGVRITLCLSGAPELIDVPWEYLFDDPDFLAVSALTPVVRYLDLPRQHRPLLVEPPLRLLAVVSSPAEYERLNVERERDNLQRALSGLTATGALELHWLEQPTLAGLLKALQAQTFHALHYIGHGAYDRDAHRGVLLFEDESGWARPASGDNLGMILHDFSSLRLAILNACEGARTAGSDPFAGVAGSLVQRDIPAVVAMQSDISDEAAIVFAGGFYEQLAAGSPVDASLAAARLAMFAARSDDIEWGTPVLFMRVPDGRIFDLDQQRQANVPSVRSPTTIGAGGQAPDRVSSTHRISINYRREHTAGHAILLADRLRQQFGHESVQLADDHGSERHRREQIEATSVFLVLIGSDWVSTLRSAAAHAEDFARREVEWALRDSPGAVIPVLIDAAMPEPQTLPRSLRGLCRCEPTELRHASFDQDLAILVARLQQNGAKRGPARSAHRATELPPERVSVMPRANREQLVAGIPQPYHDHYLDVTRAMLDATVVPLLGPGIRGTSPTADHLAVALAERFQIDSSGLAEVAQRVSMTVGERRLHTAIKDLVDVHADPAEVHLFLAEFPAMVRTLGLAPRYQLIISADYDCGLERAFEDAGEPFDYAVYIAESGWFVHVPWGERASEPIATTIVEPRRYVDFPIGDDGELERTIIVKIHGGLDGQEGDVAWSNNYVVTEDQYIDYLPTHNIQDHLPIQILDKLTSSRCLFLGYVLRNWNARVFLRRIWRGKPISENSWAIDQDPDLLEKATWSVIGHVELLAASLPEYVGTLRSMLANWRIDN